LAAPHPDRQATPDTPAQADLRGAALSAALAARRLLERGDQAIARFAPSDRAGLVVFMLHCVFADDAEAELGVVDPHERATPEHLARLIDHMRGHGYRFVGANEIDNGLAPGGLYAHLSFDDGFANNLHLLDLLGKEDAYATVFPSVNHVREGRNYWWNALYRERNRRGQLSSLPAETAMLRRMTGAAVDRYLVETFGATALEPSGDVDRPLSVEELRHLADSDRIEIGNHTLDHAILTNYSQAGAEAQIAGAQAWLEETTGRRPRAIAYPNGDCNDEIVEICRSQGLRLGATVASFRNRLPLGPAELMRLGRFRVVFDRRTEQRLRAVRSSVQLTAFTRRVAMRLA
jgi:peptidoglycan/xylan/chitin deacetylase (PgdA/CDA1 family)